MIKLRNLLFVCVASIFIYACGDDNFGVSPFADVNYEQLAISDNDSIVKFLKGHYYDATVDSIKPITSGQTAMFDETSKIEVLNVTANDIDHKLYVYIQEQGNPTTDKGFPTQLDSVFVKYSGRTFTGTSISETNFDQNTTGIWFNLTSVIRGWTNGFTKFKGGNLKTGPGGTPINGPITYENTGKGYLFIPSGLAYPSSNQQNWNNNLVDAIIMFKIELQDFVEKTDHDNDGVPSITEDLDGDKNPNNDDTDGDGIPDFLDTDDDQDGVLTRFEDANRNGNPADDTSDPNNPDLPDYRNPAIRVKYD